MFVGLRTIRNTDNIILRITINSSNAGNSCFKGNNCRSAHEPFAPNGATKDVELARALPETIFDTPVPLEIGSTVSILITFINGPTEV
ncbi:GM13487 [Drosophila sechellia]|uniref:GM13487 n=1 Tax=Drosophila sechellia TaxID=7238 RepID=B4IEX5_DROSE|nr:GM13487 [Drosophila sechellia]